jgi:hypothetical protein
MIDLEYLRRHYADLSDEALREIDRDDLVEAARRCYDEEVARRSPARGVRGEAPRAAPAGVDFDEDDATAACVCAFGEHPATDAAGEASEAMGVLEAAGIPGRVAREPGHPAEWRVLVPGSRELEAMSVLDCQIFNPKLEAAWRAHFDEMADEDLRRLSPAAICGGLLDRAERLRRAYEEALERRGPAT